MKLQLIDKELEINWRDSWNIVTHITYRFTEFNTYMHIFLYLHINNYET